MHSEDRFIRLIEHIYDAALAPERWPEFLEALAVETDGHSINISFGKLPFTEGGLSLTSRFDPLAQRLYREYYFALDPWAEVASRNGLLRTGIVGLGRALLNEHDLENTEFINDFGKRFDIRGGISAIIRADETALTSLSLSERTAGRRFGEPEVLLVRRLLPHLQRACLLHERLGALEHARSAAEQIIDRMPFGVILLDGAGRPRIVNRTARQILDSRDGLVLRGRTVAASTTQQTLGLRTAIAQTLSISRGDLVDPPAPIAFVIPRPSLKRPLQVLVVPVRSADTLSVAAAAAIFVTDPDSVQIAPESILRTLYGLTPAEARLASELLQLRTVEESAEILGVSLNTARTQLKRLFEKTNTRRQSELLQLMGHGVGQLRT